MSLTRRWLALRPRICQECLGSATYPGVGAPVAADSHLLDLPGSAQAFVMGPVPS